MVFSKLVSVLTTHVRSSSMSVLIEGPETNCCFPFGLSVESFPLTVPRYFHVWLSAVIAWFSNPFIGVLLHSLSFSSPIFLQENHPQCCSLPEVPNTSIKEWSPEGVHKWIIIQDLSLQPPVCFRKVQERLCFISFHWRSCKFFLVSTKQSEYSISPTPRINCH